ncbi:MAG: hypothetical protein U9N57_00975 [Pseudomonadota bacterium]|nr:hypothetical protein [Pseudomonadota bacterium]
MNRAKIQEQKGFIATIEIAIILAGLAYATMYMFDLWSKQDERDRTRAVGNELAVYQSAVQRFVSYNEHGGVIATPTILIDFLNFNAHTSQATALNFAGTDWLKKNVPGLCDSGLQGTGPYTANQSFLNCLFRDETSFRQAYSTDIWFDTANGTIETETVIQPYDQAGNIRKDLTSMAANAANSSTYGSFSSNDALSSITFNTTTGEIVMKVSNNSAVSSWLLTNGQNNMNADLDVGGYSVVNAQDGDFSGTLNSSDLNVTTDASVGNNLIVGNNLGVVNGIVSDTGDIIAAAGKLQASNGVDILGVGNLTIADGRISIKNVTPGTDYYGADSAKKADLTLQSDTEMVLQFDSGSGLLVVDGDTYNTDINRYASQAVYDVSIVANGAPVNKPTCPVGKTPQVFLGASSFSRNDTVKPIGAVSVYAIDNGALWNAYLEILDEDGVHGGVANTNASFPNISILAVTKCT